MYGISTEDMDSLTLGTPRLIRHLMAPASQKLDAMEFDHAKVGQRYMCSYWALAVAQRHSLRGRSMLACCLLPAAA